MNLRDQGYLSGFILGDGSAHHNKANRAYEVTIDQISHNRYLMRKLFEPLQVHGKPHHYKFNSPDGMKWRLRVNCKSLYFQVIELKTNPVEFFNKLNSIQKLNFIGGYIDADGTYTDRLVLYSKNYELLIVMKQFLAKHTIMSAIYEFNASTFNPENKLIYGLQFSTKLSKSQLQTIIPAVKLEHKEST